MQLSNAFARAYRSLSIIRGTIGTLTNVRVISSLAEFIVPHKDPQVPLRSSRTLDIGCGPVPRNPFDAREVFGIDICRHDERPNIAIADLTIEPIPHDDASFDYVTAFDFIEHVPRIVYSPDRRFPFVQLMNEIWRVLRPDGLFLSHTPAFPFAAALRDPTHVNIITHETFPMYFDDKSRLASMYGFHGSFVVVDQAVRPPWLLSLLQKPSR